MILIWWRKTDRQKDKHILSWTHIIYTNTRTSGCRNTQSVDGTLVYIQTYTCLHTSIYKYIHIYICAYLLEHLYANLSHALYIYIYLSTHTRTHTQYKNTFIHIHDFFLSRYPKYNSIFTFFSSRIGESRFDGYMTPPIQMVKRNKMKKKSENETKFRKIKQKIYPKAE